MTELKGAEVWMTPLLQQKYDQGVEYGRQTATSIDLGTTSYGACHSAVIVLTSKSRRGLTKMVKERNWRREGDNPGQVYGGTCNLIRVLKTDDNEYVGICIASTLRDV